MNALTLKTGIIGVVLWPALWLGMLIGVSFLATPVKFKAASLSFPTALEVGRVTFHAFARMEWVMAAGLVLLVALARFPRWHSVITGCLVLALALQALWLLPILDARVQGVLDGTYGPPSFHHMVYAITEGGKCLLLIMLMAMGCAGLRGRAS